MSFARAYGQWTVVHAVAAIAGVVVTLIGAPSGQLWGGLILAVWGAVAMAALFVLAVRLAPRTVGHLLPHLVTAVRTAAAPFLLAFVWYHYLLHGAVPLNARGQWLLFAALLLVETSDYFDGRLARMLGPSPFGSIWDMETDAFFALSLSLGAYFLLGMPPAVLAIGLMRYLYVIATRVDGDPPGDNRGYKLFAKTVAATLTVTMIAAFAPMIPFAVRAGAIHLALVLQIISFGWDALLQLRGGRLYPPWRRRPPVAGRESSAT